MNNPIERAEFFLQRSRHQEAESELRRALAADPDEPTARAWLALCLTRQKRNEEALSEIRRAISQAPSCAYVHYLHTCILRNLQRYVDAEAAIQEAIRLCPERADYFSMLAEIHLHREMPEPALQAADQGLRIQPDHLGCLNLRAAALGTLGQKSEALATIELALGWDPEHALTHANKGWMLLEQGDRSQAIKHFGEALRLAPSYGWAQRGMAAATEDLAPQASAEKQKLSPALSQAEKRKPNPAIMIALCLVAAFASLGRMRSPSGVTAHDWGRGSQVQGPMINGVVAPPKNSPVWLQPDLSMQRPQSTARGTQLDNSDTGAIISHELTLPFGYLPSTASNACELEAQIGLQPETKLSNSDRTR